MKNKSKQSKSRNFLLGFVTHVFYGVYFLFYIVATPFRIMLNSNRKKKHNLEINDNNLNIENNQANIDKIFDKKLNENKQQSNFTEKKQSSYIGEKKLKNVEKENAKIEKKRAEKEKKELLKQELLQKKQEKQAKIEEQKRLKKEKREQELAERKAKKEAKRNAIREKRRQEKEKNDLAKKVRQESALSKNKEKKLKEQAIKQSKEEKRRLKQAAKEQARLDKKEAALAKKRKTESFMSENYDEVTKNTRGFKKILKDINNIPNAISKFFSSKYKNSMLYRNAKNKKDRERQVLLINFDGEDAVKSEQKQVYEYVGKNAEGKIVKDYFPAYSRVEVHSFLLSEGYEVYSIKTSKSINLLHKSSASVNTKFKNKDLIFFLTQLSTYIKAGIPLVESLKILSRQFKRKAYQKIFRAMIYNLTMGDSFSIAMEKQGRAFPNLLINMIKASEMTGELPEALDDMAEYYTEADATRKQMITALTYPAIVFIFALGVITFIMLYVVPKFVDIYNSMDSSSIPGFTLFVMNLSAFLQENAILVFGVIVAIVIMLVVAYRNVKGFRWAMQWVFMHIPVIKNIIIYNEVTMFTKTFSSLLSHNVFITDTLEILSKITNNEIYKMLVRDTAANLERGEKISTAYKDQWAFPIPAYEMIVTGERTGQLAEMMGKVSTYYQDLHKNTVSRLKAFIEPILIVGLTVVVGFIVLAIVIPMFNLYNQVM